MTNRPNAPACGILDERVQARDPKYREQRPGRIVRSVHTVTVEYNNYDGHGPFLVDHDIHDLERSFPPDCETTVNGQVCSAPLDFRGQCYHADRHDKKD